MNILRRWWRSITKWTYANIVDYAMYVMVYTRPNIVMEAPSEVVED